MVIAIGGACSVLSSIFTWVFTRGGRAATLAIKTAEAEAAANKALAFYNSMLEIFHKHELSDVENFTKLGAYAAESTRQAAASEARLTKAMDTLGERMSSLTERLDRVLSNQIPHQAPQA